MKRGKTVRELIEELQKLDQNACVWQIYDMPYAYWPIEFEQVGENARYFNNEEIRETDYASFAG